MYTMFWIFLDTIRYYLFLEKSTCCFRFKNGKHLKDNISNVMFSKCVYFSLPIFISISYNFLNSNFDVNLPFKKDCSIFNLHWLSDENMLILQCVYMVVNENLLYCFIVCLIFDIIFFTLRWNKIKMDWWFFFSILNNFFNQIYQRHPNFEFPRFGYKFGK